MVINERDGKNALWLIIGFLVSLICYHFLLYRTSREDFFGILLLFSILGLAYFLVLRNAQLQPLKILLVGAVLLRLSLLFAIPELSDDFYRFIWDGRLWNFGMNPFANLPSELIAQPDFGAIPLNQELFKGLNSPDYFTIYPPVSQLVFVLSTTLFPDSIMGNIIVMRVIILACEAGTIFLLPGILKRFNIPQKHALIYAWNPLVIIELTGNLHFEAIMILFLLWAIWSFQRGHWWWSAVALGAAVSTKLVPLIFLPLLWGRLPLKKVLLYYILTGITVTIFFLPMLNQELLQGMSSSLSLYFQKFEFNASIYYLVREVGYAITGFNIIQTAGKLLALLTFLFIVLFAWRSSMRISWPQAMMWALLIYLLFTTTVHPWYITPLVLFATFGQFRFPVIWSILVILSYAGYTRAGYSENLWLVTAEYMGLAIFLIAELQGYVTNLFDNKLVSIEHENPA